IMTGETNRTISISQDGTYHCIITNVDFPDLAQVQTGTYTMFNAGPFLTDSTAVAKIYTLNNNNSLNWNLNSPISTWNGISHSGNPLDRITDINIQNKNISTLPNDINVLDALNSLQIDNNYLTFEELEKITQAFPSSFIYAPQNKVGETLIYSHTGNNITLNLPAEINSPNNSYQWYKDNIIIVTGGNSSTYTTNEMGSFYCLITNSEFPDLTLKSNDQLILNAQQFVTDSSAVADIYTKNINNTLTWDINQPITSWEGITFANGRINQVKVNNAGLDTIPSTFANLDQLDTLFVHNNSLTFESLENIFTTLPQNFIYTPQSKIGSEQYLDVSGGVSTTLNLPDDFDTNTANNTFQWYNNGQAINNANDRTFSTSTPGIYHCEINNSEFSQLTLISENFILFDQQLLEADSVIIAEIFNSNPDNSLNWDLNTPIETWDGISVNFSRVTALNIDNKKIDILPDNIGDVNYLDTLIISNNNISTLPVSVYNCNRLIELNIANNNIAVLEQQISNLTAIKKLNISNNEIEQIPVEIENINTIDTLIINDNKLTFKDVTLIDNTIEQYIYSPQDSIDVAKNITSSREVLLQVDQSIDSDVSNITYQWYFNDNKIDGAIESSYTAYNKGKFNYTFNKSEFPELTLYSRSINIYQGNELDETDSLALIELYNVNPENTLTWDLNQPVSTWNGITIKNNRVTEINLPDKNLTLIPSDIENLTNIKSIQLQFNNIHTIPEQLTSLESLQVLNLNGNKITRIIDGFSNMT
ncbi:leucine-rich repeat domain-containing protein, partial [Flammeovirga sp. SJP92]|uniref:leucine-rich repeat domain-containing protein n=1 Tax=Flammeovirga sp. SJP92 TaxID=1775430 RepID=UPI0015610FF1